MEKTEFWKKIFDKAWWLWSKWFWAIVIALIYFFIGIGINKSEPEEKYLNNIWLVPDISLPVEADTALKNEDEKCVIKMLTVEVDANGVQVACNQ